MRFAYADPPYLGQGRKMYGDHPEADEYDSLQAHESLIQSLLSQYPDGWALSLSVPSLRHLLPLCPEDVRIGSWVKGWCSWKPGVAVAYAWEPVLWRGGHPNSDREWKTRDWVMCNVTTNRTVRGAKPEAFCRWVFGLLGVKTDDELVDIFPGSGAVGKELERWQAQGRLGLSVVEEP